MQLGTNTSPLRTLAAKLATEIEELEKRDPAYLDRIMQRFGGSDNPQDWKDHLEGLKEYLQACIDTE